MISPGKRWSYQLTSAQFNEELAKMPSDSSKFVISKAGMRNANRNAALETARFKISVVAVGLELFATPIMRILLRILKEFSRLESINPNRPRGNLKNCSMVAFLAGDGAAISRQQPSWSMAELCTEALGYEQVSGC